MQSAEARLEERKAAFKAGPNGTRKREESQTVLRKEKRDKLLGQRRGASVLVAAVPTQFETALSNYNKAALLAGDPQQLVLLSQLLHHATQDQAERFLPLLLCDTDQTTYVVVHFLTRLCFSSEIALRALINATRHVTTHDVACAHTIIKADFLIGFANHRTPSTLLWELTVNLALSCPEGRNLIHKECCEGGMLPFLNTIRQATVTHDTHLQSAMIHLSYSLLCTRSPMEAPNDWYGAVFAHMWAFVLQEIQPIPHANMETGMREALGRAVHVLATCIRIVPDKELTLVPIMLQIGIDRIFQHLSALCAAQTNKNQIAILLLLGRMSLFNVRDNPFHESAHRCGIFKLMVFHATRPDSAEARGNAFRSFGNYLMDDYKSVGYLMGAGAMSVLLNAIRREHYDVRCQAMFALMSMILICYEVYQKNMQFSQEANELLRALVTVHKILNAVVPFISAEDTQGTRDAVVVLLTTLRWNKECVMNTTAGQEAEDQIQLMLPQLKGRQVGTDFYNTICAVETLMDSASANRAVAMDETPEDEVVEFANDGKPFFF